MVRQMQYQLKPRAALYRPPALPAAALTAPSIPTPHSPHRTAIPFQWLRGTLGPLLQNLYLPYKVDNVKNDNYDNMTTVAFSIANSLRKTHCLR